jgi:hypothetical protein
MLLMRYVLALVGQANVVMLTLLLRRERRLCAYLLNSGDVAAISALIEAGADLEACNRVC